jgi:hypothetical protein
VTEIVPGITLIALVLDAPGTKELKELSLAINTADGVASFRKSIPYAGLGTSLPLGPSTSAGERRGEGPVLQQDDLTTYRRLARREDPFGVLQARNLRSNHSQF